MKKVLSLALSSAAVASASAASANGATLAPALQKVVELLQGMRTKGQKELQEDKVQFAAFKTFCEKTTAEKQGSIEKAASKLQLLQADVRKSGADAERLGTEIAKLDATIASLSKDLANATKSRQTEAADNAKMRKDLVGSIDALTKAIDAVSKGSGLSLLEVSKSPALSPQQQQALALYLASSQEEPVYKGQSGGVLKLLQDLKAKFVAELAQLDKEEASKKAGFELLAKGLKNQIDEATATKGRKASFKGQAQQSKATGEGNLKAVDSVRLADQKYLKDLVVSCKQKAADFQERQKLRTEELENLGKAVELLSTGAVNRAAGKKALLQVEGSAFAQLRVVTRREQARVADFLKKEAAQLNSKELAALAAQVSADKLEKVRQVIKDLITTMKANADAEDKEGDWCSKEVGANKKTREEKTSVVAGLKAETDQLSASIAKVKQDVVTLTEATKTLDGAMKKATKIRQKEKKENQLALKDAIEAQEAINKAITLLKSFYNKAAQATAFAQLDQVPKGAPQIFNSPYKGQGGGAVGLLETLAGDFARLQADTRTAESNGQKEFERLITDSKADKKSKEKQIESLKTKRGDQETALNTKSNELKGAQKELAAADAVYKKLKPQCIDRNSAVEELRAKRKAEIDSLEQAIGMLKA